MSPKSANYRSPNSASRSAARGRAARDGKQSPYTRAFVMAVFVTVISSVAFLGVLTLALGAG